MGSESGSYEMTAGSMMDAVAGSAKYAKAACGEDLMMIDSLKRIAPSIRRRADPVNGRIAPALR